MQLFTVGADIPKYLREYWSIRCHPPHPFFFTASLAFTLPLCPFLRDYFEWVVITSDHQHCPQRCQLLVCILSLSSLFYTDGYWSFSSNVYPLVSIISHSSSFPLASLTIPSPFPLPDHCFPVRRSKERVFKICFGHWKIHTLRDIDKLAKYKLTC